MALITLQQFADNHNVSVQAIRARVDLKIVKRYGKKLISESAPFTARPDCRRKPSKLKRK